MKIVTFGEIMGRLTPPGFLRLRQALPGSLDLTFAGAEANVAASLAMLVSANDKITSTFVSALPANPLGDACIASLRALGVDTQHVVQRKSGRLGLYFVETGANQRPSQVLYDREGSTISQTEADHYNWNQIFTDATWLHITGITPAISAAAAESTLVAASEAKQRGLSVSCDLNFRKKLWNWQPETPAQALAQETMRRILPNVDLVIANEEDCSDVLGIQATNTDVHAGQLAIDRYPDVARQLIKQFPNVSRVGITLRESRSASHNNWGAMLFEAEQNQACFAPLDDGQYAPYPIRNIVDRVGGGDAFAAGLIYSLVTDDYPSGAEAIRFAAAASCLAHSIVGDFNFSTLNDIQTLMAGSTSGRVVR
ncbi:MAG: sugar kinase [Planctomycetaceae bacterium]|nr:sugar kinase [Planctomycetaceae bacterium]